MTATELDRGRDLVDRFEALAIDPGSFRHRDHVEAAYEMLRRYPFLTATARYAETIRAMAAKAGAADKFHMTVTVAFMALIAERMDGSAHADFDAFREAHPDLFARDLLHRFYSPERLRSAVARRIFVLPDEAPASEHEPEPSGLSESSGTGG